MDNIFTLALLFASLALTPAVSAHSEALNLSLDLGSAEQKTDRFSERDHSFALTLGYDLSPHWLLNLSYTDFGEVFTGYGILTGVENNTVTSYETRHYMQNDSLGLALQYLSSPILAGWALGARIGLTHIDTTMIDQVPELAGLDGRTRVVQHTALTVGVLARYALTEKFDLFLSTDYVRGEIQRYSTVAEDIQITRLALGLKYNF